MWKGKCVTVSAWQPEGQLELDLLAARQRGDQEAFLRRLARAELLFPLSPGGSLMSADVSGRRCVLSCTSQSALGRLFGAPGHVPVRLLQIAAEWPDVTGCLAVNPGLPIEIFLPAAVVLEMAAFSALPATDVERSLAQAKAGDDIERYAETLLRSVGMVVPVGPGGRDIADPAFPWIRLADDEAGGDAAGPIVAFTSAERLRDRHGEQAFVPVDFATLAAFWPDPDVGLAVDPGLPHGAVLVGPALAYLRERVRRIGRAMAEVATTMPERADLTGEQRQDLAHRLVARRLAELDRPAAARAAGPVVQVVIAPALVDRFLQHGHDRAAGLIHRNPARLLPLAVLYEQLGLLGDGSPFGADDEAGYVLRWVEPDPDAYRSPTMDGVDVPDGAGLWQIGRTGAERKLAEFRSGHWQRTPRVA
jgi:hypothetical protein